MDQEENKPPFLESWKNIYMLILGNLIFMVLLMYLFSKSFI